MTTNGSTAAYPVAWGCRALRWGASDRGPFWRFRILLQMHGYGPSKPHGVGPPGPSMQVGLLTIYIPVQRGSALYHTLPTTGGQPYAPCPSLIRRRPRDDIAHRTPRGGEAGSLSHVDHHRPTCPECSRKFAVHSGAWHGMDTCAAIYSGVQPSSSAMSGAAPCCLLASSLFTRKRVCGLSPRVPPTPATGCTGRPLVHSG